MYKFLVVFLVGLSTLTHAQSDFIVTLQNDTLRGEVMLANYGNLSIEQIMLKKDGKKTVYKSNQIKAFQMKGDEYHTIRDYQGYKFMKLVQGGYLSSYLYCLPGKEDFSQPLLVKRDGAIMSVPTFNFKKKMAEFLIDAPELVQKIEEGQWSRKEIETIVSEYNQFIAVKSKASAAAPAAVTSLELGTDISGDLDRLRLQVAKSNLEKKGDILEMINDIEARLKRGEKIPGFMANGLLEYTEKEEETAKMVKALLAKVK
jgi:hypothetical protein